jgi:hypothetical protein
MHGDRAHSSRSVLTRLAFKLAALSLLALGAAACGSSKAAPSSAQARRQVCKHLEAVLSDGPEPEADPVGYAQAQVLPLRQIHTSDRKAGQAIEALASSYQSFASSDGAAPAKLAVRSASRTLDTICPGASS